MLKKLVILLMKKMLWIKRKNNIITFYIKTNDIEEVPVRVLIDSGSDLNFIHLTFVNKNKIKLNEVKRPFNVTGLGYGTSTIYEQTEKGILRFKNHFEVIQHYALYISDVDIILGIPWIEKYYVKFNTSHEVKNQENKGK